MENDVLKEVADALTLLSKATNENDRALLGLCNLLTEKILQLVDRVNDLENRLDSLHAVMVTSFSTKH